MARVFILILIHSVMFAQKPIKLMFNDISETSIFLSQQENILPALFEMGFPEAEILDSIENDSFKIFTISKGIEHSFIEITLINFEKSWLKKLNTDKQGKIKVSFNEVFEFRENTLLIAAEFGYPMAQVVFENWKFSPELTKVNLIMDKKNAILIGAFNLKGENQIQKKYFTSLLNLHENRTYNHENFLQIEKKISSYPHIQLLEKPQVTFDNGKANILIHPVIEHKNKFDFLLGILPNSNLNNKMILTGIAKGLFNNLTGWGDQLNFNYEQIRPLSRNLDAHFFIPFIPGFTIGTSFDFSIEKRDTNFIQTQYQIGLIQPLDGASHIRVFWKREKSSLLSYNEIENQRIEDYIIHEFGLDLKFIRLNNLNNPRKGWITKTEFAFGQKKSNEPNTLRFSAKTQSRVFIPLFKNSTIMAGVNSGWLVNRESTFTNEMFRIGGIESMRGFDQELFFAENYSIITGEYRFLIDENAYLGYFLDFGIINLRQHLWGTGGGISFETSAGIFNFSLGFGKLENSPFDFSSPKIHFGYVSIF